MDEQDFDPSALQLLAAELGVDEARGLADRFRVVGRDLVRQIEEAAGAGDVPNWQRLAHGLKSAAAALGLTSISTMCHDIELACQRRAVDEAKPLTARLPISFQAAIATLDRHAAWLDGGSPGAPA